MDELYVGADPAAAGFIRSVCQWHIAPTVQEEFRVRGSSLLLLPTLKLVSVDLIDGVAPVAGEWEWLEQGQLWNTSASPFTDKIYTITFTHGYAVCPPEIRAAAEAIVQLDKTAGMSSVKIGNVQVNNAPTDLGLDGLPPRVASILAYYRLGPRT